MDGENDAKVLAAAGAAVIDRIREANMKHLFRFGRKQAATATLVAGTATVALPVDFYAVATVQLVDFTTEEPYRTLEYIPWEHFNEVEQIQTSTGSPTAWTSKNTFDDSTIILYPEPDASTAASHKLKLTYFERVEEPSSDEDIIDAPKEFGAVLCWGARANLALEFDGDRLGRYTAAERRFRELLHNFVSADRREPNGRHGFKVARAGDPFDPKTTIRI